MSKEMRKQINKVKNWKQYLIENVINDIKTNEFTESPQFKSWFGNSKVVDNEGKPLPVYHGSPIGGIETFKKKENSNNNSEVLSSGLKEYGIFFTTNIQLADLYRKNRKLNQDYVQKIKIDIEKLNNILYNVRNNRDYDAINNEIDKLKKKLRGGVYQSYLKMETPYIFDAKGKNGDDGWRELKIDIGYKTAIGFDAVEAISGNNNVYKSNYDGIIAKNIIDLHIGTNDLSKYKDFAGDAYMVFSPSQIMIEKEF